MPTLRELGEVETLRRLAAARHAPPGTVVDAGDDAAVLRPSPASAAMTARRPACQASSV